MGDPQVATTHSGKEVHRQARLFVPNFGMLVPCAPYDNHFVFFTPELHQSSFQCTCGAPAVVANVGEGQLMLVCLVHMTYGRHVTGERTWM